MFLRMNATSGSGRVSINNHNNTNTREETLSRRRQPDAAPQPEQGPNRSFPSMSSLGNNMSRQTSSNGLFNSGEDGDESYMYFMDGEVRKT